MTAQPDGSESQQALDALRATDEALEGRDLVVLAARAMRDTARRRGVDDDTLGLLALDAVFSVRSLLRVDPWRKR